MGQQWQIHGGGGVVATHTHPPLSWIFFFKGLSFFHLGHSTSPPFWSRKITNWVVTRASFRFSGSATRQYCTSLSILYLHCFETLLTIHMYNEGITLFFRLVFDKENDCKSSVSGMPDPAIQGVDLSSSVVDLSPLQITVDTFEIILNYLYTSEIVLDEENIQNILQAADLLLLAELKQACCEYLLKCITPQNCLGIWDFASRFNCSWVRLKTTQYIENNFR